MFPGKTEASPDGSNFVIRITSNKDPYEPDGTKDPLAEIVALVNDIIFDEVN